MVIQYLKQVLLEAPKASKTGENLKSPLNHPPSLLEPHFQVHLIQAFTESVKLSCGISLAAYPALHLLRVGSMLNRAKIPRFGSIMRITSTGCFAFYVDKTYNEYLVDPSKMRAIAYEKQNDADFCYMEDIIGQGALLGFVVGSMERALSLINYTLYGGFGGYCLALALILGRDMGYVDDKAKNELNYFYRVQKYGVSGGYSLDFVFDPKKKGEKEDN